jgi:glycosyltransferase involved in cell wall biosynthesis
MTEPSTAAPLSYTGSSDSEGQIELSVVLPCLNEAETLEPCVVQARDTMKQMGIRGEVVVADNGSSDGSQAIAARLGARVVNVAAKGYGSALMGGIAAARGTWIIMGDADQSYDLSHIPRFMEQLHAGVDLVMGNRFLGGIKSGAMPPLHRYLGNPVLSGIGRLFFRCPCRDFHCGLRGFRKDVIVGLDLQTTGMEFASEMVVKATMFGLRIAEVPTTLSPDGRSRPPHLRSWRDGWRHLRFLLMFSPRWLFLYPGFALFIVSDLLMAWLLPGPRQIGQITLDVHAMLYAAVGMLVGFQGVLFAVLSTVFAMTAGLAPPTPQLQRIFGKITLETGLLVGAALIVVGVLSLLGVFLFWSGESFGPLNPQRTLRFTIPGVVATALGFQTIMASFLLSMMGLPRKNGGGPSVR